VGLYSDASDNPGSLLISGTITSPVAGAWNSVVVSSVTLTSGTKYWIAVLGPVGAGTVHFRDVSSGGRAQTSSQSDLTGLPATWSSGTNYTNAPMSAYAVQQTPPPVFLVGDQTVESGADWNSAGTGEAFQYTATASGSVNQLNIFLDSDSTATQAVVGLYTDASDNPGTLLTQGTITNPVADEWNAVNISAATVVSGTTYWIAVLGPVGAGTVRFRDVSSGGRAQTSSQTDLTGLPATWSSGTNYTNAPMSAYAAEVSSPATVATTTIAYTYDSLYRLANATYSAGDVFTYTYDAVGNRLTETTITNTTVYTYDIANRLTNVGGVAQTWDNNGNLLNDGVYTYTYDSANRLTSAEQGANTYTFAYSGLGDRMRQVAGGITTTYTLDLNAGLTQVLADGTNTYLYGNGRIAQYAGTAPSYFLGDALGSVRQLANSSGAVTLAKSYQPYGSVLSSAGSGTSNYAFTGEWQDATNLLHLRARYLSVYLNQWIQPDPIIGQFTNPQTLNRYSYVQGNPINRTDPSGLFDSSTCTVEGGDTVYGIARKYVGSQGESAVGSLVQEIIAANNLLNPNLIHPGQRLVVPSHCPPATSTPTFTPTPSPTPSPVPASIPPQKWVGEDGSVIGAFVQFTAFGFLGIAQKIGTFEIDPCPNWYRTVGAGREYVYDYFHKEYAEFDTYFVSASPLELAGIYGVGIYTSKAYGFSRGYTLDDYNGLSICYGLLFAIAGPMRCAPAEQTGTSLSAIKEKPQRSDGFADGIVTWGGTLAGGLEVGFPISGSKTIFAAWMRPGTRRPMLPSEFDLIPPQQR